MEASLADNFGRNGDKLVKLQSSALLAGSTRDDHDGSERASSKLVTGCFGSSEYAVTLKDIS